MYKLLITALSILFFLNTNAQTTIKIGENIVPIIGTKVSDVIIYPSLRENENRTKETSFYYKGAYIAITQITYAEENKNEVSIYKYAVGAKLTAKQSSISSERFKGNIVYTVEINCNKTAHNEMTFFDTNSNTPDLLIDQKAIVSFTTKAKAASFAKIINSQK